MEECILFTDSIGTVFILDIPRSLEQAIGDRGGILSSSPPDQPYDTPEPKGKKREALEAAISADEKQCHEEIQLAIRKELCHLHSHDEPVQWCLSRLIRDATGSEEEIPISTVDVHVYIPTVVLSPTPNHFQFLPDIQNVLVVNPSRKSTEILVRQGDRFLVPDRSSFIWSSIRQALRVLVQAYESHGINTQFDIILMDPPWPNRSVRHARAYLTADIQELDPFYQALDIVIQHLKEGGHVAVWITNKWEIRQTVLSCMAEHNFVLVEQWMWTKVTTKGEPVTPLSGLWRKPYEVLLIFQRKAHPSPVLQRHIFAVPDLHSRKPNLRTIFDRLFSPNNVLELFARNLTAGWTSIGDEVLKFQDAQLWFSREDLQHDQKIPLTINLSN